MAEEEEDKDKKKPDLGEIDDDIRQLYNELMDVNFKIISRSRRQAQRLEKVLELYADQIQRISELKDLHIEAARSLSDTVGDILTAEWDIDDGTDTADDEEEEEDDGT